MRPRITPGSGSVAYFGGDGVLKRRMLFYDAGVPASPTVCTNYATGDTFYCDQQPYPTLVLIIAGIVSMGFLVSVALLLLYCSFYKDRTRARQATPMQVASINSVASPSNPADAVATPYDDLVIVYMPGVESAIFARPAPLIKAGAEGLEPGIELVRKDEESKVGVEAFHPVDGVMVTLPISRHGSLRGDRGRVVPVGDTEEPAGADTVVVQKN